MKLYRIFPKKSLLFPAFICKTDRYGYKLRWTFRISNRWINTNQESLIEHWTSVDTIMRIKQPFHQHKAT